MSITEVKLEAPSGIIDKWQRALRHGGYLQGRKGYLRIQTPAISGLTEAFDEYCCLGVLCDVIGLTPRPYSLEGGWKAFVYDNPGLNSECSAVLPQFLVDHLGLHDGIGSFRDPGLPWKPAEIEKTSQAGKLVVTRTYTSLLACNDAMPSINFLDIADMLTDYRDLIFREPE